MRQCRTHIARELDTHSNARHRIIATKIWVAASGTTHGTVILWHDTAQVNVLNWRGGDNSGTPKKLPLGHTPRDWNLFSNNDDFLQVVWLIELIAGRDASLHCTSCARSQFAARPDENQHK